MRAQILLCRPNYILPLKKIGKGKIRKRESEVFLLLVSVRLITDDEINGAQVYVGNIVAGFCVCISNKSYAILQSTLI